MDKIEKLIEQKESGIKLINPKYDLKQSEIALIMHMSTGTSELVINGFYIGYMRGLKFSNI